MRLLRRHWVGVLFALDAIIAGGLEIRLSHNNFNIFADEFHNVLAGINLYALHPAAHFDVFRYSPTFALLFAPFALSPLFAGMILWSLLNAMVLYAAVRNLLPQRQATLALLLMALDVNNAIQNLQSNALIAGLMVLAFVCYERRDLWRGAAAVSLGAAIKIFPAGAALFGLLHAPRGGRPLWRTLAAIAVAGAVTILLPLPFTGGASLLHQYQWWFSSERTQIMKTEYSFMAALVAWFGGPMTWWPVQLAGLLALLVPIAWRRDAWHDAGFRLTVLASVLCWVVLFNHRAESPSYVIAMTGVAVWWAAGARRPYQNVLLLLVMALSALPHDFVPPHWRDVFFNPARTRVIAVFAAWVAMQVELIRWKAGAAAPVTASGGAEIRQA